MDGWILQFTTDTTPQLRELQTGLISVGSSLQVTPSTLQVVISFFANLKRVKAEINTYLSLHKFPSTPARRPNLSFPHLMTLMV